MKRTWTVVAVVLVCTPMVLTLLLLLAVMWPKMDALTLRAPMAVRSVVCSGILGAMSADTAAQRRAKRLDPVTAREYQQQAIGTAPPRLQELYTQQVESRKVARGLVKQALAQEKAGQECAAEELDTQAAGTDTSAEVYQYAEGLGRAGLKCGDLPGARAGLEAAILKQENFIKGTEVDQLTDVRQDMLKDQQYLIVVYQDQHETALARKVCSNAYAGWTSCACTLKGGDVSCASHP